MSDQTELPDDPRKRANTTSIYVERRTIGGVNLHIFLEGTNEISIELPLNPTEARRIRNAIDDALGEDD